MVYASPPSEDFAKIITPLPKMAMKVISVLTKPINLPESIDPNPFFSDNKFLVIPNIEQIKAISAEMVFPYPPMNA